MLNNDILARIAKHKATTTDRKFRFNDLRREILSKKGEFTKALVGEESACTKEDIVAGNLSNKFYFLLSKFHSKSARKLPVAAPCKRGTSYWHRVARLCIEANIDPDLFLKAQFVYFRDAFGRAPHFSQLVTASALARAVEYERTHKLVPAFVANKVTVAEIPLAEKFKIADKRMRDVCRTQEMTRKEVYENLVIPGFLLLPKEYMEADPVYSQVANG